MSQVSGDYSNNNYSSCFDKSEYEEYFDVDSGEETAHQPETKGSFSFSQFFQEVGFTILNTLDRKILGDVSIIINEDKDGNSVITEEKSPLRTLVEKVISEVNLFIKRLFPEKEEPAKADLPLSKLKQVESDPIITRSTGGTIFAQTTTEYTRDKSSQIASLKEKLDNIDFTDSNAGKQASEVQEDLNALRTFVNSKDSEAYKQMDTLQASIDFTNRTLDS